MFAVAICDFHGDFRGPNGANRANDFMSNRCPYIRKNAFVLIMWQVYVHLKFLYSLSVRQVFANHYAVDDGRGEGIAKPFREVGVGNGVAVAVLF